MFLEQSIELLPRTSFLTIKRLRSISIRTFEDLLDYIPFRYEDYSLFSKISQLQPEEKATVKGWIKDIKNIRTRTGLTIQKIYLTDDSGTLESVWYNQPYLLRVLKKNMGLSLSGQVKKEAGRCVLISQEYEILKSPEQSTIHTGRLIPVYPEKKGLSSRTLREKIFHVIGLMEEEKEWLPKKIVDYNHLTSQTIAYRNIHFPTNMQEVFEAKKRLAFEELFLIQLSAAFLKKSWLGEKNDFVFEISNHRERLQRFVKNLPFLLTDAQSRVIDELIQKISGDVPMNHFLQGDVGSGKTVVATVMALLTYLNGYRTLFMAPTQILAQQHYQTVSRLLIKEKVSVGLITGGHKNDLKQNDIVIGTQALLNKRVNFDKVGLVIIDEQHRFGVEQRAALRLKGHYPHLLTMTATPIPRTVALTLYGHLDMSVIDQMPRNRLPVKTFLIDEQKRQSCYRWIKKQISDLKTQVFIICPLIDESEKETMVSVKAAKKEYDHLKNSIFPEYKVALIHGKMKQTEKDSIMNDFKNRCFDILVATSLIEVGIDIPNASIMVIEGAERYGLSQLHQLRGRVGRGQEQSYCVLFAQNCAPDVVQRLGYFTRTISGLELAEYDLRKRGSGNIFGTEQHGFINLKIANLGDFKLIDQVKKAVDYFVNNYPLEDYPKVKSKLKILKKNLVHND
ncbi:ATP-dependent DNA helicase RecG [Candidatus Roizmanbacteria bacterium]|nr:ATP-dependent DNA helicase RecG [Candidatus Roizmanbacteria bacterium]